jgi:hypothetical protein
VSVPATVVVGQVMTAAWWNLEVRDQFNGLKPAGVQRSTAVSSTISTTETAVNTVTFTVDHTSREYRVIWSGNVSFASDIATNADLRFRWATGASVTNTSTQIGGIRVPQSTALGQPGMPAIHHHEIFTPGVTGQITVGAFLVRVNGTGNMQAFGSANAPRVFAVIPTGP